MTPPNAAAASLAPRLAYLLDQYPSFSHAAALQEVQTLRSQGFEIQVASVNRPDRPLEELTLAEAEEAKSTFCVKAQGLRGALSAMAWALKHYPLGFARSLRYVWQYSGLDLTRWVCNHCYWIEALIIGRWMEQQGLQHLHIHCATRAASVGLIARQAFPIRYSLTVRGPDEFYDASRNDLRKTVIDAEFILCISHFARSQLMALVPTRHWNKLHVCRPGVNPEVLRPVERAVKNEFFTIVSVGPLIESMGHLILLQAVKRLNEAGRALRLYLIGAGPLEAELKNWILSHGLRNVVTLTGPVGQDHILEYYACADCVALASFADNIPLALIDAMAMGIPCVTTRIGGTPELIHDERDGLLVAAGDDVGLAAAIGLLVDDPVLGRKLGLAGRARVEADYNARKNMRLLGEKFRALLSLAA